MRLASPAALLLCLMAVPSLSACKAKQPDRVSALQLAQGQWPELERLWSDIESEPYSQSQLLVAGAQVGRALMRERSAGGVDFSEQRIERWLKLDGEPWPWVDERVLVQSDEGRALAVRRLRQGASSSLVIAARDGTDLRVEWSSRGTSELAPCSDAVWEHGHAGGVLSCAESSQAAFSPVWEAGWPEELGDTEEVTALPRGESAAPWITLDELRDLLRVRVVFEDGAAWRSDRQRWHLRSRSGELGAAAQLCDGRRGQVLLARNAGSCELRQLTEPSHASVTLAELEALGSVPLLSGREVEPEVAEWAAELFASPQVSVASAVRGTAAELSAWVDEAVGAEYSSPAQTLARRRGSCIALSQLLVAALESQGVPARVELGLTPSEDGWMSHHAWVSFWDGQWNTADPALGSVPASASNFWLSTWPSAVNYESLDDLELRVMEDLPVWRSRER